MSWLAVALSAQPGTTTQPAPLSTPPAPPAPLSAPPASPAPATLAWDAKEKSVALKDGEPVARFEFAVTNLTHRPITIQAVDPSCGCTTVDLPPLPWTLAPGAGGMVRARVDLEGKDGEIRKGLRVMTSAGEQILLMHISVPIVPKPPDPRATNIATAHTDRQAVFRGDCARCHADLAADKTGAELFDVACGICHDSPRRASLVPDLTATARGHDAAFWRATIRDGHSGTLMPAFAKAQGGPLSDEQIESLVAYTREAFAAKAK